MSRIMKMAVIGAGTMGAAIAATGARMGLDVLLLDVAADGKDRSAAARGGLERTLKAEMKGAGEARIRASVTVGNTDDDIAKLADRDLVVEAVFEDIDVKRGVIRKIFDNCGKDTIVGTNTSNISINAIGSVLSDDEKKRFMGIHFFNPVRYMSLVEIIPAQAGDCAIASVRELLTRRFGKRVVLCKDTPGFIANRIGSLATSLVMSSAVDAGYSATKTDKLTGELIFRPRTGTFKLVDVVGLDIAWHTADYMAKIGVPEWEKPFRTMIPLMNDMMENKRLGNKTKGGFYKKNGKQRLMWDWNTGSYVPQDEPVIEVTEAVKKVKGKAEKLFAAMTGGYAESAFLRRIVLIPLWACMMMAEDIADDTADIDTAMRCGYNWEKGPFEICDAMGAQRVIDEMEKDGLAVPEWAKKRIAEQGAFNKKGASVSEYIDARDPRFAVVIENEGAMLKDIGDGILCYTLKTKGNSFSNAALNLFTDAIDTLEKGDYKGMVVRNYGPDFSFGANIADMAAAIQAGQFDYVDENIAAYQTINLRIKYSKKPVVAAVQGRCLGGGCELMLSAARVVASHELYAGLVEFGVGLIPGGGGCKELAVRASEGFEYGMTEALLTSLDKAFTQIALATVSMGAEDAMAKGMLRPSDRLVADNDALLQEAKLEAIRLYDGGYLPPVNMPVVVTGETGYTHLCSMVRVMRAGNYVTDYEAEIAAGLARVMTGGDAVYGAMLTEQQLLDIERTEFVKLCHNQKTMERIAAMLTTGKPLRN